MSSFARFALPALIFPLAARVVLAQPPTALSSVKIPATDAFRAPPLPDPPQITALELQTLTGGSTLVTWSGTDVPVDVASRALFEAARLTENNFGEEDEKKTVSVDWKQIPFWTAAAELENLSGRRWDGRLQGSLSFNNFPRSDGGGLDGRIAAQTPFVTLIANSLRRTTVRTVGFGPKPLNLFEPDRSRLTLSAYFDPKLRVQSSVTRAIKFWKAGATTPIESIDDRFGYRFFARSASSPISEVVVDLPAEAAPGTTFWRISGVLHTVVASDVRTFSVPDLLTTPKAAKMVGPDRYELQEVSSDDENLRIRVMFTLGGEVRPNPLAPVITPFFNLKVRDGAGNPLFPQTPTSGFGPNARGDFSFSLKDKKGQNMPGPYSLEWPIVTQTRSLDIPFELRDVVVP